MIKIQYAFKRLYWNLFKCIQLNVSRHTHNHSQSLTKAKNKKIKAQNKVLCRVNFKRRRKKNEIDDRLRTHGHARMPMKNYLLQIV